MIQMKEEKEWTKGRRNINLGDCNMYQNISSSYLHKGIKTMIHEIPKHASRNQILPLYIQLKYIGTYEEFGTQELASSLHLEL
jgi:hypothetical protein